MDAVQASDDRHQIFGVSPACAMSALQFDVFGVNQICAKAGRAQSHKEFPSLMAQQTLPPLRVLPSDAHAGTQRETAAVLALSVAARRVAIMGSSRHRWPGRRLSCSR